MIKTQREAGFCPYCGRWITKRNDGTFFDHVGGQHRGNGRTDQARPGGKSGRRSRAAAEMDEEALRDLHRLLQNAQSEIDQAKRTWRPFPGGPRIRI
jgi:predicted  nucleic acid-binding Zn-ribbon protein